jgi:hypothetical protein
MQTANQTREARQGKSCSEPANDLVAVLSMKCRTWSRWVGNQKAAPAPMTPWPIGMLDGLVDDATPSQTTEPFDNANRFPYTQVFGSQSQRPS